MDGLSWPVAPVWTALIVLGTSCSWTARPNVFSILFTLTVARVCVRLHEGLLSRRQALWLLPLFAVWANTHGGFLAGFLLLGTTFVVEVGQGWLHPKMECRQSARGRGAFIGLLTLGAILATFLTPYGPGLYRYVLLLLGEPYFMSLHQEWRSPDFHGAGAIRFELLILLFPLVLGLTARRPSLVEIALSVTWLHLALTGFRYVALWVVIAGPVLARCSIEILYLRDLATRLGLHTGPGSLFATRVDAGAGAGAWLWTGAFTLALLGLGKSLEGQVARHKQEVVASESLDRFLHLSQTWQAQHGRRPVIFHSYDWGGYLVWHGWPGIRNWIDDRNEVQGKERIQDYFVLLNAEPGWQELLDRTRADLVCIESGAVLTRRLSDSPTAWRRISTTGPETHAIIFERIRPVTP